MSFFRRFRRGGSKPESERPAEEEPSVAGPASEEPSAPEAVDAPENLEVPEVVDPGAVKGSDLPDPAGTPSGPGLDDLPEGAGSSLLDDLQPDSGGLGKIDDQSGWTSATSHPAPDGSDWPAPTSPPAASPPPADPPSWISSEHTHTPGDVGDLGEDSGPAGAHDDQPTEPRSQYPDSGEDEGGSDEGDRLTQHRPGDVIGPEDDDDDSEGERESQGSTTPIPDEADDGTGGPPPTDPAGNVIDPNVTGGDTTPAPDAGDGEATEVDPSTLPGFGDTDPDFDSDDAAATAIDPSTLPGFGHTDPDGDTAEDEPDVEDLDLGGGDLL